MNGLKTLDPLTERSREIERLKADITQLKLDVWNRDQEIISLRAAVKVPAVAQLDALHKLAESGVKWDDAATELYDYQNGSVHEYPRADVLKSKEHLARIELQSAIKKYREATT
jgi:hypothetical protein